MCWRKEKQEKTGDIYAQECLFGFGLDLAIHTKYTQTDTYMVMVIHSQNINYHVTWF